MKYLRNVTKDINGRVLYIDESVSFESEDEKHEWWDRATKALLPTKHLFRAWGFDRQEDGSWEITVPEV